MKLNLVLSTCSMVELGELTHWDLGKSKEKFETELEIHIENIIPFTSSRSRPKIIIYNADGDATMNYLLHKGFKIIHHYDGWLPHTFPRRVDIMVREILPLKPVDEPDENIPVIQNT